MVVIVTSTFVIKNIITSNRDLLSPWYAIEPLTITLLSWWVMSVVCLVESNGTTIVVKMYPPWNISPHIWKIEAQAFEQRNKAWVVTPHVYSSWTINYQAMQIPYIIMDFVKAETISRSDAHFYSVWKILWKMSTSAIDWYWPVVYDQTNDRYSWKDSSHSEVANIRNLSHRIDASKFLTQEKVIQLQKALKKASVVIEQKAWIQKPVWLHTDMSYQNIFATEPFTVFDPDCTAWHSYKDVAYSIFHLTWTSYDYLSVLDQIVLWYASVIQNDIDLDLLYAYLLLVSLRKWYFRYEKWLSIWDEEKIQKWKKAIDLACSIANNIL